MSRAIYETYTDDEIISVAITQIAHFEQEEVRELVYELASRFLDLRELSRAR